MKGMKTKLSKGRCFWQKAKPHMAALLECLTHNKETRGLDQSEQRAELWGKEAGQEGDLGSAAAPGVTSRRMSPADLCTEAIILATF